MDDWHLTQVVEISGERKMYWSIVRTGVTIGGTAVEGEGNEGGEEGEEKGCAGGVLPWLDRSSSESEE